MFFWSRLFIIIIELKDPLCNFSNLSISIYMTLQRYLIVSSVASQISVKQVTLLSFQNRRNVNKFKNSEYRFGWTEHTVFRTHSNSYRISSSSIIRKYTKNLPIYKMFCLNQQMVQKFFKKFQLDSYITLVMTFLMMHYDKVH